MEFQEYMHVERLGKEEVEGITNEGLRWKDKGEHKGAYEYYRKLLDQM